MAKGGGNKTRFQYCTDSSGEIHYLRALQGHSGRNLIDPSLQDNVVIPDDFFEYICHVGCAVNSHSVINSGFDTGRAKLEQLTVFSLPVSPMDTEHNDPDTIDLEAPRLARYMHTAWKKHQNTVYWVDITACSERKGLKFYQTQCVMQSSFTTHSQPIVSRKLLWWKSGEIANKKVYLSPRPPPTISFKDNWMKELDSEVSGNSKDTQRVQSKPKTQLSRTVRPVGGLKSTQSCVSMPMKIEEEDQTRTVRPVGGQESTQVEEIDIDFRVPGLSHASCGRSRTFPSSRAREEDRKPSSSRSVSSRLEAEFRLQPI